MNKDKILKYLNKLSNIKIDNFDNYKIINKWKRKY